jgi:predicted component of type VI protein secretion system
MKKTRFTIGRESTCDIPVADDSVSRMHAELTVVEGTRFAITDCKSSNGTFLTREGKTRRIQQELLQPSDRLILGRATLAVSEILALLAPHLAPAAPIAAAASAANATVVIPQPPPPPPPPRLKRCACGAIQKDGARCPICEPS